jgi:hypothetical protein
MERDRLPAGTRLPLPPVPPLDSGFLAIKDPDGEHPPGGLPENSPGETWMTISGPFTL